VDVKIILAGYRNWAIKSFETLIESYPNVEFVIVKEHKSLLNFENSIILCAGWSWIFKKEFIEKNKLICLMHPSDLPDYAGGSPIQNQIIAGLESTKATLFKADSNVDSGPILKKIPISLKGDTEQIFLELERVTIQLFSFFIENYPKLKFEKQIVTTVHKRLKPNQSKLTKKLFNNMTVKEIYNFIRCRTDPYPNVYLEDNTGRLYFKKVRFKKND
jgi:methionyl-tRNA formyltransferase